MTYLITYILLFAAGISIGFGFGRVYEAGKVREQNKVT